MADLPHRALNEPLCAGNLNSWQRNRYDMQIVSVGQIVELIDTQISDNVGHDARKAS